MQYDVFSEEVTIAYILINNENFDVISSILQWHDFYQPVFQEVYKAIASIIISNKIADPHTISSFVLNKNPNFQMEKPLIETLTDIVVKYATSVGLYDIKQKAEIIQTLSKRRQAIKAVQDFTPKIIQASLTEDTNNFVESLEEQLFHIMEDKESRDFKTIGEVFSGIKDRLEFIKKSGVKPGIDTGYHDLNQKLFGWHDGDLIILAGRPSMGKTALAIGMALNSAKAIQKNNKAVAVFSLEMSSEQLVNRMIAVELGISGRQLASGNISDAEFELLVNGMQSFGQIPIVIDDTPALTVHELRTKIRRMKRKHNIAFAVVDYLQLMRSSVKSKDNRVQEISEITQNLKAIAREFKIPLLALSQLSRSVESRDDKRPMLQDLRESGSIEQDADIVMFLYRESYYLERLRPSDVKDVSHAWYQTDEGRHLLDVHNLADLIIAKHRNGDIGTVQLHFDADKTKFSNLAK
jgi:replicative DNA helicase